MKHWLSILCCVCCISVNAQDFNKIDSKSAAANLNPYPVVGLDDSQVPAGYTPFYISHYGRHGSRYLTHDVKFDMVIRYLEEASSKELLTRVGEKTSIRN